MADKKISQLDPLLVANPGDLFPIASSGTTYNIQISNLMGSPGPIGANNADTGEFTSLQLTNPLIVIDAFSTDTALGTSDTTIPTQNAVKEYVDAKIGTITGSKISQGDSSVEVIDTTAAPAMIISTIDNTAQLYVSSSGINLINGVSVNEISNDATLVDASPTTLVTEYAVKEYVDNHTSLGDRIVDGLGIAQIFDSTSDSYFKVEVRDTFFGPDTTSFSEVYYFNDSTAVNSNWSNKSRMVDGNTSTLAQAGSAQGAYIQLNPTNTTPSSTTRNIEKVEFRVYGRDGSGPNISAFNIYPVFNGLIQGNSQNLRSFLGPVKAWTPWIDITSDPAAPENWQWTDLINLHTKVEAIIGNPGGGIGDILEVGKIELQVTYTESPSVVGAVEKFRVNADGLSTQYGTAVNEFSTDVTLADSSNKAIPTERAVKTYVDYQIQSVRNDLDLINIRHISSDSTAVTGDVCLVNTGPSMSPINIQMLENPDGRVIVKKVSLDDNPIYVTTTPGSTIDGENTFVIDTPYKSITFLSDGNNFFII